MASRYIASFFGSKRPWSKYKDAVLAYYLKPYLAKVKSLGKPLCVVDMFAGRGRFATGEPGSPLIIAEHLAPLVAGGTRAKLLCIESDPSFHSVLEKELEPFAFAEARQADCVSLIAEIADLANTHTTFLYIDPCDACQLQLVDLATVYSKIRQNSSVEVLMVFMARAFLRQAALVLVAQREIEAVAANDPLIAQFPEEEQGQWVNLLYGPQASPMTDPSSAEHELTAVAGGDYWRGIVRATGMTWRQRLDALVLSYKSEMRKWFKVVESFPIHADRGDTIPKYWLVFGTRYPPALDLFNRAACNARRKQGIAYTNEPGSLFAGVPIDTKADPFVVDAEIAHFRQSGRQVLWDELRRRICSDANIGRFTDSEIDHGIRRAVESGTLREGAPSDRGRVLTWQ